MRPDVVLRVGAPLTEQGRDAVARRRTSARSLVDPDGAWLDPDARRERSDGQADPELAARALADAIDVTASTTDWVTTLARRRRLRLARSIDAPLDGWDEPFEGAHRARRVRAVPDGGALVVASSMPVRDVESLRRARATGSRCTRTVA